MDSPRLRVRNITIAQAGRMVLAPGYRYDLER